MPNITIKLPPKQFQTVKTRARKQGFKTPNDWARFLIEQNLILEESPLLSSKKIISEMRKTDLYQKKFLLELEKSLEHANKAN